MKPTKRKCLTCENYKQSEGEIMELFDSIPYTFEKIDFEIRIYYDDVTINVVAFLNGYPANGYRYQVKIPKKYCNNIFNFLEYGTFQEYPKKLSYHKNIDIWEYGIFN